MTSSGVRVVLIAILSLALAGCLDEGTNPTFSPSSLWEGTLTPAALGPGSELPEVSGAVAVIVQSGTSRVGMGLEGVDRTLYWAIFHGTCNAPETAILPIGLFPTLPADSVNVEYRIGEPLVSGENYHVRLAADEPMEQTVSCGDLMETDPPTTE